MLAKPDFNCRQPRIFREGRRLEIITQSEIGKSAAWLALLRILRVSLIGPRRRDTETGMDEETLVIFFELHWFDNFAAPATDSRLLIDKKWNVATKPCRQFGKFAVRTIGPGQLTQDEQDCRRVGTPPAESGADWDAFLEMDPDAGSKPELIEEKLRGSRGEIILRIGERGIGASELNTRWNKLDFERIAEGNWRHERFEFMKTVGTAAHDMEIEIDFGGSELFHFIEVNRNKVKSQRQ